MDKFKLVKEFSKELTSTLELEELAHVINDFAVVHLGASHSSIVLENSRYSYNNEDREVFNGIEAEVFRYIMKVRKMLRIANPKSEYMFRKVRDIDLFGKSLISFPLVTKNQALGSLNLYFESLPDEEAVEFLNLFAELSASSIMNSLSYRNLEATSVTDKLTGLCNRRSFDIEIKSMTEKCSESGTPSSVMMIDIDNFKEYNDRKGHQEGDRILEEIGKTVRSFEGKNCRAFRYGGEEIALIAAGLKPEQAFEKAEQIRKKAGESGKITISIGIVTCLNSSCSAQKMVSEADKALYKAKKAGRNRVHSSVIIDKALSPIDVQEASELGRNR